MAEYENILYEEQRKGVAITLNRPSQMNSFNQGLRADLHAGLDEADADPEIRYIILTGAGRAFSAGADMSGNVMDGGPETVWPYGLEEGQSVAAFLDRWRNQDRLGIRRLLHI